MLHTFLLHSKPMYFILDKIFCESCWCCSCGSPAGKAGSTVSPRLPASRRKVTRPVADAILDDIPAASTLQEVLWMARKRAPSSNNDVHCDCCSKHLSRRLGKTISTVEEFAVAQHSVLIALSPCVLSLWSYAYMCAFLSTRITNIYCCEVLCLCLAFVVHARERERNGSYCRWFAH